LLPPHALKESQLAAADRLKECQLAAVSKINIREYHKYLFSSVIRMNSTLLLDFEISDYYWFGAFLVFNRDSTPCHSSKGNPEGIPGKVEIVTVSM
jgi:hypothetical protein